MFCMACGAEIANHLSSCPNCGRPVAGRAQADDAAAPFPSSARGRVAPGMASGTPAGTTLPSHPTASPLSPPLPIAPPPLSPAAFPLTSVPAGSVIPSIGAADLGGSLLPRDALSRVILATSVAMALDALVPWVIVGGRHVPLTHLGAPVLLLLAALALPIVALRPSFRQRPLWAVVPLALGAMLLGGGLGVLALLNWLAPRVMLIGATMPSSQNGTFSSFVFGTPGVAYTADLGLYLFLVGAAALMIAGYQFFLAARDALPNVVLVPVSAARAGMNPTTPASAPMAGAAVAAPAEHSSAGGAPAPLTPPGPSYGPAYAVGAPPAPVFASGDSGGGAPPPPAHEGPVLPGTAAWNQPQEAPTAIRRPSLGAGFLRPLGPRPGR